MCPAFHDGVMGRARGAKSGPLALYGAVEAVLLQLPLLSPSATSPTEPESAEYDEQDDDQDDPTRCAHDPSFISRVNPNLQVRLTGGWLGREICHPVREPHFGCSFTMPADDRGSVPGR